MTRVDLRWPKLPSHHARHALAIRGEQDGRRVKRQNITFALALGAARIIVGLITAHIALAVLNHGPWIQGGGSWANAFTREDSNWYIGIAASGYTSPMSLAYFPGYPILIRLGTIFTFHIISRDAIAYIISWGAFEASVVMIQTAIAKAHSPNVGRLSAILYAFSPTSVFLIAAYPESSIMLLSSLTFFYIRSNRFIPAIFCAGLCTAFTPLGICLSLAVAIATLRSVGLTRAAVAVVGSLWGLIGWSCWLWTNYGNPLQFSSAQRYFNRHPSFPFADLLQLFHYLTNAPQPLDWAYRSNWNVTRDINLSFEILALIIALYFIIDMLHPRLRRWTISFSVYAIAVYFLSNITVQTFSGVANPEAVARFTDDNLGTYAATALALTKHREALTIFVAVWAGLAVAIQTIFVLGWYFT